VLYILGVVETSGSGVSMNRGPRAPGGPSRPTKMCEMTHLHSTDGVFNSRRGHLRIYTKSIKTLGGWGTPLWELTPLTRPSPKPHHSSQHFGLPASALGTEAAEGPQVTVEPGPLRAFLRHRTPSTFYGIRTLGVYAV